VVRTELIHASTSTARVSRLGRSRLTIRYSAICLSTLHAPSPPEPVKLSAVDAETVAPPTLSSISTFSLSENEEILRLQKCGHEFHAECLISWFVLAKWSCPICRALYYTPGVEQYREEQEPEGARRREEV
jgi:hypothetical protein